MGVDKRHFVLDWWTLHWKQKTKGNFVRNKWWKQFKGRTKKTEISPTPQICWRRILSETRYGISEFSGHYPQTFCSFGVMGILVIYCCWRKGLDTIRSSYFHWLCFFCSVVIDFWYILFSSWTLALGQNSSGIYVLTPKTILHLI